MEAILIKIWTWLIATFPAVAGAGASIFFGRDQTKSTPSLEGIATLFFGTYIGHNLGHAAIEYFGIEIESFKASSIIIVIAFISIAALLELKLQIPFIAIAAREKITKWLS